jgi:hypothetical protein
MKRIVEPREPQTEVIVNIDDISIQPMHFAELKAHTLLRDSRKKVKGILHLADFAQKVKSDLKSLSVESGKFDPELVLKICNCAELFFMEKEQGEIKKQAVISVLLPYFKDEELIAKIIEFVYPMIHKSNLYRRNKKRAWDMIVSITNFFLRKQ